MTVTPPEKLHLTQTLGSPLPDSIHAVSVSMPHWQDVVDYEEGKPHIAKAFKTAYPRFFLHPLVDQFFKECERRFASKDERCFAFPSKHIADQCVEFMAAHGDARTHLHDYGKQGIYVVRFHKDDFALAKAFWQHSGHVVSSRCVDALMRGQHVPDSSRAKATLRKRIADISGLPAKDITLYASGMAAIYQAYRLASIPSPDAKTIQLGFPYVDTLKIQQKCGAGVHFVMDQGDYLAEIEALLKQESIAALFCEFPSNPLLKSVDIHALSSLLRAHNVPLIIDDTIATWHNADVSAYADIIVTSLTKAFSGTGDVMAGSLILNHNSPFYSGFREGLTLDYEDLFYAQDAIVLEENSRDFSERMATVNKTTEILCGTLKTHPAVASIHYPKYNDREHYDACKKLDGGYGGLFSLILKEPDKAPAFYDHIAICKGPSLGTNFTLACPYTLLAHYYELDWAASCGVDASLIRVSVGLERVEELIERFEQALPNTSS